MNCAENMKIANEFTWVPPEDTQKAKVDTKYKRKEQKKEKEKDLHKNHKDLLYPVLKRKEGGGCLLPSVEVRLSITSRNFAQKPFEGKFN